VNNITSSQIVLPYTRVAGLCYILPKSYWFLQFPLLSKFFEHLQPPRHTGADGGCFSAIWGGGGASGYFCMGGGGRGGADDFQPHPHPKSSISTKTLWASSMVRGGGALDGCGGGRARRRGGEVLDGPDRCTAASARMWARGRADVGTASARAHRRGDGAHTSARTRERRAPMGACGSVRAEVSPVEAQRRCSVRPEMRESGARRRRFIPPRWSRPRRSAQQRQRNCDESVRGWSLTVETGLAMVGLMRGVGGNGRRKSRRENMKEREGDGWLPGGPTPRKRQHRRPRSPPVHSCKVRRMKNCMRRHEN
jgi:hypothetical protein